MGGSEVKAQVEQIHFFAFQEGGGKGVNHAKMSVKIESSWPCVSREGSAGLTHWAQRGGGLLVFPRPPSVAGTEFVWIPWIVSDPYGNIWLID